MLTTSDIAKFHQYGFVTVPRLFTTEELAPLRAALKLDPSIGNQCFDMLDVDGGQLSAIAWTQTSNTLLGLLPFSARVVDPATALMGEEVYHWHSKLTLKAPHSPGRVEWHQDYGAWYFEGCLKPDLLTVGIAIEPCTSSNGALQVVSSSHQLGRIEHEYVENAQHRVDPQRLALAHESMQTQTIELDVGDAVYFHCNLLHGSGGNSTDDYRTLLLCSYNCASNSPFSDEQHERQYRPLSKVPDSRFERHDYDAALNGHEFFRPDAQQMTGFGTHAAEKS